ncbi:hypothetical protein SLEP1_g59380 [Rubroshorea leprosula]|uniref:Uncharacterized protein n=1 Tax=Rubroshorea leprosula TaxID=152421 RepID=A0AAV5MTE7_9ROSI|nr:hypothetical protein SLEP1_g59380 [Rubroshorea leprosula]
MKNSSTIYQESVTKSSSNNHNNSERKEKTSNTTRKWRTNENETATGSDTETYYSVHLKTPYEP